MSLPGFSFLDISGSLGLCAMGLLTFNFILGICLSTAYKKSALWKTLPQPIRKVNLDKLHNWTAYLSLLFVVLHPLFLILDSSNKFTFHHVFWPFNAPNQPTIVLLGSLSFYALIIVITTTQKFIKRKLSFRVWKNIHLISYSTALLFLFHGLLMDPKLKERPTDWLDAEKIFAEFCFFLLICGMMIRFRYFLKNKQIKVN